MDKYRILIVDDEPDNLALLYRTLRGKYEIAKSTSPIAALDMMKNEYFHCILSDHKMPEMDGVEFLKRTYEISPNTMRLLVTAYTDAGILIDAINYAKIYRYIKKDTSFIESHTGLEDTLIEKEILAYCIKQHKKMDKLLFGKKAIRPDQVVPIGA
jgi:response regulator RpfG family c-di-GMP phosphodiesterase